MYLNRLFPLFFALFSVMFVMSGCLNEDNQIPDNCYDGILNNGEELIDCGGSGEAGGAGGGGGSGGDGSPGQLQPEQSQPTLMRSEQVKSCLVQAASQQATPGISE